MDRTGLLKVLWPGNMRTGHQLDKETMHCWGTDNGYFFPPIPNFRCQFSVCGLIGGRGVVWSQKNMRSLPKWLFKKFLGGLLTYNLLGYFFLTFIYLFTGDVERERERYRQREKQALCGDPNMGLDPRTPGTRPEPKADTQPLSHPGIPICLSFKQESLRL